MWCGHWLVPAGAGQRARGVRHSCAAPRQGVPRGPSARSFVPAPGQAALPYDRQPCSCTASLPPSPSPSFKYPLQPPTWEPERHRIFCPHSPSHTRVTPTMLSPPLRLPVIRTFPPAPAAQSGRPFWGWRQVCLRLGSTQRAFACLYFSNLFLFIYFLLFLICTFFSV